MPSAMDIARHAIARHGSTPDRLLAVLREIQSRRHCIPRRAQELVARAFGRSVAEIEGLVGFYTFLHAEPRGDFEIYFSDCVSDRFRGQPQLLEQLCRRLHVRPGSPREDGRVCIDTTSCTGLCDQGPALLVNGRALPGLDSGRIEEIARLVEQAVPVERWPGEWFEIDPGIRHAGPLLQAPERPGEALARALELGPEGVLEELQRSGLRGRGGAGYPTALKWRYCREAPGEHYIVCNADEGEPGTFKDRELLRQRSDDLVEGMTLAAYVTGARQGFVYLRAEYEFLAPALERALRRRHAAGLLGEGILGRPGFDFELRLVPGAGAYVCGEESALLDSIEGRRGTPRNRPPYPVTAGLWGEPTVVNNVESFVAACQILLQGSEWFSRHGTERSRGTKLISVSGDCARPGIYELPFGITVAEVLELCGAAEPLAVQVGGPSGRFIAPQEFGRRIAYEGLGTGGAFMVFGAGRDPVEIARDFSRFFAHESCGFCTPCRVGTALQRQLMERICEGQGTIGDLHELERLGALLRQASHCGLGHTASNPVADTLARYPEHYQARLRDTGLAPGFDLEGQLAGEAPAEAG